MTRVVMEVGVNWVDMTIAPVLRVTGMTVVNITVLGAVRCVPLTDNPSVATVMPVIDTNMNDTPGGYNYDVR